MALSSLAITTPLKECCIVDHIMINSSRELAVLTRVLKSILKLSNVFAGTREKCKGKGCDNTVYPIERVTVNGTSYHRGCFKCCHGGCTISPSIT
ncbi:LIM domain-containing protein WLIM1-like [Hibiscus syriacus]|uniref:LIM domain-containing protein WLIM1-like n=1 Tax=Hibiscus syriacus TaxID=106335 RepID=UPI0019234711|nr:LIM domain-containing protein WLIM1-like [Hibiscus syriacus]